MTSRLYFRIFTSTHLFLHSFFDKTSKVHWTCILSCSSPSLSACSQIQPMLSMFQMSLTTLSIALQLCIKLFHPSIMGIMFHYVCIPHGSECKSTLTPFMMFSHPLQRKSVFMWFKNSYMFSFLPHSKHLNIVLTFALQRWGSNVCEHCHC